MKTSHTKITEQKGTVLLFTVLILGLALIGALTVFSRGGLETYIQSTKDVAGQQARNNLFGCLDDLFIQLMADPNFTTTTIETMDAECSVTITTPATGQRHVDLTLTQDEIIRNLQVDLTLPPVEITAISEE